MYLLFFLVRKILKINVDYLLIYNTLNTVIVHCTLYTVHCTLYIVHRTLYTVHCTPYIVHRTLYTVHCTPYIVHRTLYTVHCTLYTVHCTLYVVQLVTKIDYIWRLDIFTYTIFYSQAVTRAHVQSTSYNVRRTMYVVQCTSYKVRRTMYVVRMFKLWEAQNFGQLAPQTMQAPGEYSRTWHL